MFELVLGALEVICVHARVLVEEVAPCMLELLALGVAHDVLLGPLKDDHPHILR